MSKRKAMAFKIEKPGATTPKATSRSPDAEDKQGAADTGARKPLAKRTDDVTFSAQPVAGGEVLEPVIEEKPFRFWGAGTIFGIALSAILSIAIGMWVDGLVRDLFARLPWLGWVVVALAAAAALAAAIIIIRELAGLANLKARSTLRKQVLDAWSSRSAPDAITAFHEVRRAVSGLPSTAAARERLGDIDVEFMEARDLITLAETELLAEPDRQARQAIRNAAHRVSVVTAVSPRALVDVAYVIWESARLIRKIASIYDARPGSLGFWRLARRVIEHLAVTGTVALGDSVIQQIVGHGLAARLSARLGEGVVNGLMTARIGIAAMDVIRPAPFLATAMPTPALFMPDITGKDAERNTA